MRLSAVAVVTLVAWAPLASAGAASRSVAASQQRSLCAPPADTVAPRATGVSFSSQTVDLDTGPDSVSVSVTATDTSAAGTPSGVQRVWLYLGGPGGSAAARLALTSGSAEDGTWTGAVRIPADARAGTWTLRYVSVLDTAGNSRTYDGGGQTARSPYDISLQTGWQTSITVTGTGSPPPPRQTAGKLRGFDLSPAAVDTTASSARVRVRATFGKTAPKRVTVYFARRSRGRSPSLHARLHRTAGTQWAGHVTVPRWAGNVTVRPNLDAEFADNVRPRYRSYSADQLELRHLPSTLRITSGTDHARPTLTGLSFSPSSVDTTGGAQTVTVTATAEDAQSGVRRVQIGQSIRHGSGGAATGFYPYGTGYATSDYLSVRLHRSGDQWVGTTSFPECVPGGTWRVTAFVVDVAGNGASYGSRKLTAAGLPGTLSVTSTPGDVEPPEVRDATASGEDHTITLDFTEGVRNVGTDTLTVYALQPSSSRYRQRSDVTGIVCSNGSTTVDCSGSGGLVTSAILAVPDVSGGAHFAVYGNVDDVFPQLTDGAGNPLPWQYAAATVTGS